MHEAIENFIEKQKQKKKENYKQFLLDNDICEREYSPNEDENAPYDENYPFWDRKQNKYYKKIPIEVTDEELEQILEAYNEAQVNEVKSNGIATFFLVLGWITVIAGLIESLSAASGDKGESFTFSVFIIHFAVTLISSMIYFGFGEVIKLLNDIKNK